MAHTFSSLGKRQLLSEEVAAEVEAAIRSKELLPGAKLPSEHELCGQFSVSRTVVREALRMLSARGLIVIKKGRGIFVKQVSADTVTDPLELFLDLHRGLDYALDLVHARQVIEPEIAALAALNHKAKDAEKLKEDHRKLEESQGDTAELARLDMVFHLDIAGAAENPLIPLLLEPIHRLMGQVLPSVYTEVEEVRRVATVWHEKILNAILGRNPGRARAAMRDHLKISEEHARAMVKASPQDHEGEA